MKKVCVATHLIRPELGLDKTNGGFYEDVLFGRLAGNPWRLVRGSGDATES